MSDAKSRYAVWLIIALIAGAVFLLIRHRKGKKLLGVNSPLNVAGSAPMNAKKLVFGGGDSVTFYDAWKGRIPETSVFSPSRGEWYFCIDGLDATGKLIFSTSWRDHVVMKTKIPEFSDIKRWQVTVVTSPSSAPSPDVYKKLRIE